MMRRAGPGFVANEEYVNRYQKTFLRASTPDLVHKKSPMHRTGPGDGDFSILHGLVNTRYGALKAVGAICTACFACDG